MGITVQKALDKDEKDARQTMRASSMLRTFVIFVVAGAGVLLPWFSTWTVLIPLFFPRLIIAMRPVFDKSLRSSTRTSEGDTSDNEKKEEDTDNED